MTVLERTSHPTELVEPAPMGQLSGIPDRHPASIEPPIHPELRRQEQHDYYAGLGQLTHEELGALNTQFSSAIAPLLGRTDLNTELASALRNAQLRQRAIINTAADQIAVQHGNPLLRARHPFPLATEYDVRVERRRLQNIYARNPDDIGLQTAVMGALKRLRGAEETLVEGRLIKPPELSGDEARMFDPDRTTDVPVRIATLPDGFIASLFPSEPIRDIHDAKAFRSSLSKRLEQARTPAELDEVKSALHRLDQYIATQGLDSKPMILLSEELEYDTPPAQVEKTTGNRFTGLTDRVRTSVQEYLTEKRVSRRHIWAATVLISLASGVLMGAIVGSNQGSETKIDVAQATEQKPGTSTTAGFNGSARLSHATASLNAIGVDLGPPQLRRAPPPKLQSEDGPQS